MNLTLSAPSKTFLSGEYAVLNGGLALVLNTGPRFQLQVRKGSGQIHGIPKGSPAARWLEARSPLVENLDLEFLDAHEGQGGFGASGAQFLSVHTLTTLLQKSFRQSLEGPVLADVWNDHQVLSQGEGSGADLLAQATGQVALVDIERKEARAVKWPYPEMGFVVLRTGTKLATHEHLKTLDRAQIKSLVPLANAVAEHFGQGPRETFLKHMRTFAVNLREMKLQACRSMIQEIESQSWCYVAKGCGAMGADTVTCLIASEQKSLALRYFSEKNWPVVATEADLTSGLEWAVQS